MTDPLFLAHGSHPSRAAGVCFNEALAWLAGEKHSDSPECVSPVIRRFTMMLNDRLNDDDRQRLRPYLLRCLGTAGDGRDDERRLMCARWLAIESALPELLEQAGLADAARRLRGLPPDLAVENVERLLRDIRDEAWRARSAALDRLRAKVKAEVEKKLGKKHAVAAAVAAAAADADAAAAAAAVAAAVENRYWAVYDAARKAVREAVEGKVNEILEPRRKARLDSALDLLDRMLPEGPLVPVKVKDAEKLVAA